MAGIERHPIVAGLRIRTCLILPGRCLSGLRSDPVACRSGPALLRSRLPSGRSIAYRNSSPIPIVGRRLAFFSYQWENLPVLTRDDIRTQALEAKDRLGLTWPKLGEAIGRSPVYADLLVYGYGQ